MVNNLAALDLQLVEPVRQLARQCAQSRFLQMDQRTIRQRDDRNRTLMKRGQLPMCQLRQAVTF